MTSRREPPLVADETTMLRAFLDYYRATIRRQCDGLDAAALCRRLAPSSLTLGGMLKHLAYVEDHWFSVVLAGNEPGALWRAVDWGVDPDVDWHSAAEDDPQSLRRWFDEAVDSSEAQLGAVLIDGDLDHIAARRAHGEPVALRWILVHMIEEYARHAGHADLIRESIDGATDL